MYDDSNKLPLKEDQKYTSDSVRLQNSMRQWRLLIPIFTMELLDKIFANMAHGVDQCGIMFVRKKILQNK